MGILRGKKQPLPQIPFLSRILRSVSRGREVGATAFGVTAVHCLAKHSFHSLRDSQTKRMCFFFLFGGKGGSIVLTQNCQDATIPSNLFLLLRRGLTFVLFERTQLISMFHYGPS